MKLNEAIISCTELENTKILTEEEKLEFAWKIWARTAECMRAWIPVQLEWKTYKLENASLRDIIWVSENEEINVSRIKTELRIKWELWEYLWEWKDRIVYQHAKNENLVIKIPKNTDAKLINETEAKTYLQEDTLAKSMWKTYCTDWLARCAYNKELWVLYMQKLKITEWSNFWITADWIIRKFDLNPII